MSEQVKHYLLNNPGLKLTALLLAILSWALIAGRERAYMEKTLDIPVDPVSVANDIEVRSVRPETVRATLLGPAKLLSALTADSLGIRIDLHNIHESNKFNFYSEDYLNLPQGVRVISIHPKMIEIFIEQMVDKEVPVQLLLAGRPIGGRRLVSARVSPERVNVNVYKSQYGKVHIVFTEEINLAAIGHSTTLRVPLRQTKDILRFRDVKEVDVILTLEDDGQRP